MSTRFPSSRTHLLFWLCASSISWACLLLLVSLLQASCCFVIGMRERSSRKNGQVCQEEIVSAMKNRVTPKTWFWHGRFRVMGFSISIFVQIITATIELSTILDASVFRGDIEIPVNHTIFTISLLEPFVRLGKMATVKLEVWSDDSFFVYPKQRKNLRSLCVHSEG